MLELLRKLQNGERVEAAGLRIRLKGEQCFHAALSVQPALSIDGAISALRWILRDVSKQVEQSQALQAGQAAVAEANARLEQGVAERTADLEQANRALQAEIAEREQIEASLREEQHFTRQIAELLPDILYIFDLLEQRNVYVNPAITTVLGYTPEAFQAMGADIMTLMHPEDASAIRRQQARRYYAGPGEVLSNELRMRHADGDWRILALGRVDAAELSRHVASRRPHAEHGDLCSADLAGSPELSDRTALCAQRRQRVLGRSVVDGDP